MFDLIIRGGRIIDGTGAPAFSADLGIRDGKITLLSGGGAEAAESIDASGRYVCPGFIDAHSHGDLDVGRDYARLCKTCQGITTEVAGQCGTSLFPTASGGELYRRHADHLPAIGALGHEVTDSFSRYRAYLEAAPKSAHIKQFVGHGSLRRSVMPDEDRAPTRSEIDRMKGILRECMEDGAAGLTTGLNYAPGGFAGKEEITELCRVLAPFSGLYATHMRNAGDHVEDAVREAIETAGDAGVRLDISHLKTVGWRNRGKSEKILELIDRACASGQEVAFDVYPYDAAMTDLLACVPMEENRYPREERSARLRDPAIRASIREMLERGEVMFFSMVRDFSGFLAVSCARTAEYNGMTIAQIAEARGVDPFDAFFDLLADNDYDVHTVFFCMDEEDVCRILLHERAMVGTDGIVHSATLPTHPRGFCSFPHAIDLLVKRKKLITLEELIRKMTGFTADWLMIRNKGLIRDGYDADLVIFDYDRIAGGFTYAQPIRPNPGIEYVLADGQIVWRDGALTGKTPGRFLPHRG